MRIPLIAAAVLGLLWTGPSTAGLYNTAEPPVGPTPNFRQFRELLGDLRAIAIERPESPLRKHYLGRVTELEVKDRTLGLSAEDRANLSAYLMRLGRAQEAIDLLVPASRQPGAPFVVHSNLATAYQMVDQPDRAADSLRQALQVWPTVWPGWTTAQLAAYRRAENKQLELLRSRQQAALRQRLGRGQAPSLSLDPLFPNVHFEGPGREYQAGELPVRGEELPPDARPLVEQLLVWLPHDSALYWQVGELLNAEGDVADAAAVFDELVFVRRVDSRELRQHRQVLNEAKAVLGQLAPLLQSGQMLWWLAPRGETLAPGAAPLITEAGWAAALSDLRRRELAGGVDVSTAAAPGKTGPEPTTAPSTPAGWLPDAHKAWLVGIVTGIVVLLFIVLQVREVRRRRHGTAAAPRG